MFVARFCYDGMGFAFLAGPRTKRARWLPLLLRAVPGKVACRTTCVQSGGDTTIVAAALFVATDALHTLATDPASCYMLSIGDCGSKRYLY